MAEDSDREGKKLEKKKKNKRTRDCESNGADSSVIAEDDRQGGKKKMKLEKELSKENWRTEDEDDDQGEKMEKKKKKKKKKKKLSEESKHDDEYDQSNEGEDDDRGKEMKKNKKKKAIEESNSKEEYNKSRSNEGEDGDQGKMMKKKKPSDRSKSKKSERDPSLASVEGVVVEVDDESKEKKKSKAGTDEFEVDDESKKKKKAKGGTNEFEVDDESKKKKKKKKAKVGTDEFEVDDESKKKKKKKKAKVGTDEFEVDDESKKKKKKKKAKVGTDEFEVDDESKKKKKKKKAKAGADESTNPAANGGTSKPKRVTFSDQVEICPCPDTLAGQRFTPEDDEKIKEAVSDYIESHGLGDEGLNMVLNSRSHPEIKGCWKDIAAASFPQRHFISVYHRAHVLYERGEKRKWAPEEYEFLHKAYDQHGPDWRLIADALGKHRIHVKDAWRRTRHANRIRGHWTQDEYQRLFDLVNKDLQARATAECRKSKHGMLRDNISWEAISDKFETRSAPKLCDKWYNHLMSPLVADGVWSDTDDYRLLNALYTLDACSMEEVDWDNLVEHRAGDVCRKRWSQMVHYIREHGGKSFAEQVEILAKRFCPDLLEAREAFDSKPVVC